MIHGVHISSSGIILPKELKLTPDLLPRDRLVTARVISLLPKGGVRLEINGQTLTAQTGLSLEKGEELQLRVSETRNSLVLNLQAPPKSHRGNNTLFLKNILSRLTGTTGLKDLAAKPGPGVETALESLALKSDKADPDLIPRLIQRGGMLLESRIQSGLNQPRDQFTPFFQSLARDLKAAVLTASGETESASAGRAADTLEAFQLLNSQTQDSGRLLLPLPVLEDAGFRFGQLLMDSGGKDPADSTEGERVIRASFLLDMTKLGAVRADFSFLNKAVSGGFLLETDHGYHALNAAIPELKNRLVELGYQVRMLTCSRAQNNETQETALLDSLFQDGSDSVLNIVI
ncbi:MAG: flagellar hook-length control protein FliK [Desulfobacterales bacterium]|nr:flagellar hook-length control protein FliK [Desulfobacterales bacterium]